MPSGSLKRILNVSCIQNVVETHLLNPRKCPLLSEHILKFLRPSAYMNWPASTEINRIMLLYVRGKSSLPEVKVLYGKREFKRTTQAHIPKHGTIHPIE